MKRTLSTNYSNNKRIKHNHQDDIIHKLNIMNVSINNIFDKLNNINNRLTTLENNFNKYINVPTFKTSPTYFY